MDQQATAPAAAPGQIDAELRISTHKAPTRKAADTRAKINADLAEKAAEMRERAAAAPPQEVAEAAAAVPAPREDVESIEIKLLDDRVVVLGPPKGVSLTMRIAMTIPEAITNPMVNFLARTLMSVRSVNGQPLRPIGNIVDLTKLANEIGDVGIEELNFWYQKHWGELRVSDLQLLKKNLRG
jgi:hypothetical protein